MLDIDRFNRIIENLANNAMRYNPKGTMVTVSLTVKDDQVLIDFIDNGIVIPDQIAVRIFKPFVRADDSRN